MYPAMYISHVQNLGPFLKVYGQFNRQTMLVIEETLREMHSQLDAKLLNPAMLLAQLNGKHVYVVKSLDGHYKRCKVLEPCRGGMIKILLIDYGNEFEVPAHQVCSIRNL